jgi:hypothetical protein
MTPEKLAELEALEAAATPGEWANEAQGVEWRGLTVAYCPASCIADSDGFRDIERNHATRNATFIAALRNNACDLFAALREAWRERDEARAWKVAALKDLESFRRTINDAYDERNRVVALAARLALLLGWRAGHRAHEPHPDPFWEPGFCRVVHIDLPTGQASWHFPDDAQDLLIDLPEYDGNWDKHDNATKYKRLAEMAGYRVRVGSRLAMDMPVDRLVVKAITERDEARAEVARLKEQLKQATEKAAMFQQAAEDWRYIAKQYQDARAQDLLKKET